MAVSKFARSFLGFRGRMAPFLVTLATACAPTGPRPDDTGAQAYGSVSAPVGARACNPGDRRCGDGEVLEVCTPDGASWALRERCADDAVCLGGRCVTTTLDRKRLLTVR